MGYFGFAYLFMQAGINVAFAWSLSCSFWVVTTTPHLFLDVIVHSAVHNCKSQSAVPFQRPYGRRNFFAACERMWSSARLSVHFSLAFVCMRKPFSFTFTFQDDCRSCL